MASKLISSKRKIAITLLAVYEQHDYQIISQKNFDLTVLQLDTVLNGFDSDIFFANVAHGKYGVLYKMPTSILSMAQKYIVEKRSSMVQ